MHVFPSERLSWEPDSGDIRRYHAHESSLQRTIKAAGIAAGILIQALGERMAAGAGLNQFQKRIGSRDA